MGAMMWVWGWVYWEHSDNNGLQKTEHQWQESLGQKRVSQAEEGPGSREGRGGGRKASHMGHQNPVLVSPALPRPQPSFPPWAWEQGLCRYFLRRSFHASTPLNTPGEEGLRGAVGTFPGPPGKRILSRLWQLSLPLMMRKPIISSSHCLWIQQRESWLENWVLVSILPLIFAWKEFFRLWKEVF